ncbi:MAG: helix-turn-helix transcriptional regulator [Treponema sp.]|jgi:AraC-like DNA-binding protein|nr:helix-turn-helix transcriptional regulator [Treponema sp.]
MRKNHRVFVSFSISFLLFVIIPVLVLNVAAWQAIRITEQNERQNCIRRLSDGREKMENWIRNIHSTVSLIRVDDHLNGLEKLDNFISARDRYDIWLALQSIGKMELANRQMDVMIYYRNPDLVLSPTFMAGRMTDAYGIFFRFGENDYADFLSSFNIAGNRPIFFPAMDCLWDKVPLRGLLYGMRLRISGNASLFFLLQEQQILQAFSPIFSDKGALYIYSPSGDLIFSHGGGFPPEKMDGDLFTDSGLLASGSLGPGITGAYSRSDHGLLYVSALETDTALNHVRTLRNLTFGLNLAAILLSLGYAVFLAARNSRQVMEAFRLLDAAPNFPSYEGGNTLSYLNSSVVRLINTNTLLRADANSRREMLKAAFLDRLLNGDWENREESAAAAEQSGIPVAGRRFCVVFLILKPREENAESGKNRSLPDPLGAAKQDICAAMEGAAPGEALIHSRHPNRIGFFFFLSSGEGDFRNRIEALFQERAAPVCAERNLELHLIGSALYDDVSKLREGYNLCREYALIRSAWEDTRIHWIDTLPPPRQQIFVFPLETEQKLINQLQNADFEGARNLIHSVFAANLQELLSESMLRIFYATLQGCFLKSLEGPLADPFRDTIQNLDFRRFPQELEEEFTNLAQQICSSFAAEYSNKNVTIKKEELTAYVEEHFGEERLSLRLAARHFGFSETYFSQMFKETTGKNFSTFTEITRLEHAQTLLKRYLKVEEIAYRCGYKSPNSFRRAYKRYFGINPTKTR